MTEKPVKMSGVARESAGDPRGSDRSALRQLWDAGT